MRGSGSDGSRGNSLGFPHMPDDDPLSDPDVQSVYRRLFSSQIVFDDNQQRRRPSSQAYRRRKNEVHASVCMGALLREHHLRPLDILEDHEAMGLASLLIESLRAEGADAIPEPVEASARPHKCDPAHGSLIEPNLPETAIRNMWRRFAKRPDIVLLVDPGEA